MKQKKKYNQPQLNEVVLDQMIVLQTTSDAPPGQGELPWETSADNNTSTTSTETTKEPLKDNNFEDNPFER
jgi:hypothetical protein